MQFVQHSYKHKSNFEVEICIGLLELRLCIFVCFYNFLSSRNGKTFKHRITCFEVRFEVINADGTVHITAIRNATMQRVSSDSRQRNKVFNHFHEYRGLDPLIPCA